MTADELRRALLDCKPEVVHFAGHGTGVGQVGSGRDFNPAGEVDAGGLVFEDDAGNVQLIPGDALAGLFKLCDEFVKCVVLNACYSEAQANTIVEHIDFVVGMKEAIGDKAAVVFALGFYDGLFAERDFEQAFELGKNALDLKGIPGSSMAVMRKRTTLRHPSHLHPGLMKTTASDEVGVVARVVSGSHLHPGLVKTAAVNFLSQPALLGYNSTVIVLGVALISLLIYTGHPVPMYRPNPSNVQTWVRPDEPKPDRIPERTNSITKPSEKAAESKPDRISERHRIDFSEFVNSDPEPTPPKEGPLDPRGLIPRLVDQLLSTVLPADFERPTWLLPIASMLTTLGIMGLLSGLLGKAATKRGKPSAMPSTTITRLVVPLAHPPRKDGAQSDQA